jgi:alanine racemase
MQDGANALEGIELIYLMSHLSSAEAENAASNGQQLEAFKALRPFFAKARASLANSGGVLLDKSFHFDMTRPGIALYGAHPAGISATAEQAALLQPAVNWDARILQLRHASSGEAVGYGGTHILTRDSLIATIGVGYGDGYPRCLGGIAVAQIDGHTAPIIGRISMDSMALDVTDIPETTIHSTTAARLLGPHYDTSVMARDAGTISYEILTGLGQRPARRYVGNS